MTLYETIFKRRSVRKYEKIKLEETALLEIKNFVDNAKQLPKAPRASFEIADSDNLKGGIAPYAILAYSDDSDASFINIGYTLQAADLWLQSAGYGSVWCGMASPKKPKPDYRILLGFGKTSAPLRAGENDFKRKKLADISSDDNAIIRAARLAPSAINFQPWKINSADGQISLKPNVSGIGKILPGKLFLYDLGIIAKHAEIALEHEGKVIKAIDISGGGKNCTITVSF
ncbi:MAG: hypothetical protein FWC21_05225 [Treponema sp.]|nr:hypothetical protein [Treponema sp.]